LINFRALNDIPAPLTSQTNYTNQALMEDQMAMQRGEISRLITLQDKGMSVASQLRQAAGELERMQTFDAQVSELSSSL